MGDDPQNAGGGASAVRRDGWRPSHLVAAPTGDLSASEHVHTHIYPVRAGWACRCAEARAPSALASISAHWRAHVRVQQQRSTAVHGRARVPACLVSLVLCEWRAAGPSLTNQSTWSAKPLVSDVKGVSDGVFRRCAAAKVHSTSGAEADGGGGRSQGQRRGRLGWRRRQPRRRRRSVGWGAR